MDQVNVSLRTTVCKKNFLKVLLKEGDVFFSKKVDIQSSSNLDFSINLRKEELCHEGQCFWAYISFSDL